MFPLVPQTKLRKRLSRGARNDTAGRMLTVTLTNDLDGTMYG
jgi:hypothetical protein